MATRRSTFGRHAPKTRPSVHRANRPMRSGGATGGQIGNVAGFGSGGGSPRQAHARSGRVRSRTSASATQREVRGVSRALAGGAAGSGARSVGGPEGGGPVLSRRNLIAGAVGIGAIAALGAGAAYLSGQNSQSDDLTVLDVPEGAVASSEDLGDASPSEEHMTLAGSFDLEYGTLVWASDDQVAACLIPCETANPLCQVGILSLSSGNLSIVLESAQGSREGFQIYDVRATTHGVVWVESDILEDKWRVYTARLSQQLTLGQPVLADEGEGDWETPSIAAVDDKAFWQVMPEREGSASAEDSVVKMASLGSDDTHIVYTSSGRLATPPYAADGGCVIAPRVDTSGVYYRLARLDASTGETTDSLILPQGMSPLEAGYGDTGFAFSFDAIYDYGGGIANLGTYCPAQDAQNSDYSSAPWFRFARTPSAAPAWCGGYFMVKSTTSVCGVDIPTGIWFSLGSEDGADDYGDYLATTGSRQAIVTYANIDHTPLNGESIHCCRVRVWRPLQ